MIKAIETEYNGYRFRSRLEARWAVFFDALGIKYEYEPEGYKTPSGYYMPDFFIKFNSEYQEISIFDICGFFIEIKGFAPKPKEIGKLAYLAKSTMHHSIMFIGPPWDYKLFSINGYSKLGFFDPQIHCMKEADFAPGYFPREISSFELESWISQCIPFKNQMSDDIYKAVSMSKKARFEHGESGAQ